MMVPWIDKDRRSALSMIAMIFLAILTLTGCDKDDKATNGDNQQANQPPAAPSNLDGEVLSDSTIALSWVDNSNNEVYFAIYRKQVVNFLQVGSAQPDEAAFVDYGLLENTSYSYYVRAANYYGFSATSDTITLMTLDANDPPETPEDPFPPDGAAHQSVNIDIAWSCADPDDGDTLSYDIYFGVVDQSEPPLVAEAVPDTLYDPGLLYHQTLYRWRIVAHDNHGHSTSGSLWSFTTQHVP